MIKLVNSCKKTTELIDKQLLTQLTMKEKMQLKMHKSMCKTCTAYVHQSKLLDSIVYKWFKGKSKVNLKMPEKVKHRIVEEINKI
jgi:hypothetical protein